MFKQLCKRLKALFSGKLPGVARVRWLLLRYGMATPFTKLGRRDHDPECYGECHEALKDVLKLNVTSQLGARCHQISSTIICRLNKQQVSPPMKAILRGYLNDNICVTYVGDTQHFALYRIYKR